MPRSPYSNHSTWTGGSTATAAAASTTNSQGHYHGHHLRQRSQDASTTTGGSSGFQGMGTGLGLGVSYTALDIHRGSLGSTVAIELEEKEEEEEEEEDDLEYTDTLPLNRRSTNGNGGRYTQNNHNDNKSRQQKPRTEKKGFLRRSASNPSSSSIDEGRGYLRWQHRKAGSSNPKTRTKNFIYLTLIAIVGWGGWMMGVATRDVVDDFRLTPSVSSMSNHHGSLSGQGGKTTRCNPYDLHGVLNVNLTAPYENKWQPIDAPKDCQPIDWLSKLYTSEVEGIVLPELEFARDKTIVIFGDSVDRDHNEHFCQIAKGKHEMVPATDPLSPPYPKGKEVPPATYKNLWTGLREWPPAFEQSRPFICHIEMYNLRIVNVFHYGFRDETPFIVFHPHYYPPAKLEDRFDQILVPLMENISKNSNVSSVPDIISITPGFWGLLRMSIEDDEHKGDMIRQGMSEQEASEKFDVWNTIDESHRNWFKKRMAESLKHIARGWRPVDGSVTQKPVILWRALHHIREFHNIPFERLQAVDQIGRYVVEHLVAEGRAAEAGEKSWSSWTRKIKGRLGLKLGDTEEDESKKDEVDDLNSGFVKMKEKEALQTGLGSRLRIDEWGALMLGQEKHFRDAVHPLPLPGSFLWGNMIMQQLKMVVQDQQDRQKS